MVSGAIKPSLNFARLGAPGRRRRDRIVRPGMLRIAAAHLGAHGGVAAAPEAGQVARRLHRPVRRRQQARSPAEPCRRRSPDGGRGRTVPARGSRFSGRPPPRSRSAPASRSAPRNGSAPRHRAGAAAARAGARSTPAVNSSAAISPSAVLPVKQRRKPFVRVCASAASDRSGHDSSPSLRSRART